jgi:hypothetical protein
VSDGTRTRDRLDHNQELYLLSYAHRGCRRPWGRRQANVASARPGQRAVKVIWLPSRALNDASRSPAAIVARVYRT